MSQDFNMRYPLIEGHGNFGSIDGDSPAAMRYTESRLSRFGETMLNDINKNTVDFIPNFDGEEMEPSILSTLLPTIMLNGNTGIAVGMATNIPPHNVNDVYNALNYMIDCTINEDEIDIDEIIRIIKGPDFPTGGTIINSDAIPEIYKNGYGKVIIRSKYEIDDNNIIITEIPYKVNKSRLIERIDFLSRPSHDKKKNDKKAIIPEIKEVRDESDKNGIRIVIELKKNADPQRVINLLLKYSDLQCNFSINNTVIKDGEPKTLNIYDMLNDFLVHSANIIIRRSRYDYDKNNKRYNIVDGLLRCLEDNMLEQVINAIRFSEDPIEEIIKLGFNREQAEYISEMKIKTISKASQDKLIKEKNSLEVILSQLNLILNNNNALLEQMKKEFNELKDQFSDNRRTKLTSEQININEEDLIKDETLIITITNNGIIKSISEKEYNTQKKGGKGNKITNTKEDEIIKYMFTCNSKDSILFFTNLGKAHILKAYKIQKSNKLSKGKSIMNYLSLDIENNEFIVNALNINSKDKDKSLLITTKNGIVKRIDLSTVNTRYSSVRVINFKDSDSLTSAILVSDNDDIIITTKNGMGLRTSVNNNIRKMGRSAYGIKGIKLKNDDIVIKTDVCNKEYLFTITEFGMGKMTKIEDFTSHRRAGIGISAYKTTSKTGKVVDSIMINKDDDLLVVTEQGIVIRIKGEDISITSRSCSGSKILSLKDDDKISTISVLEKESSDE